MNKLRSFSDHPEKYATGSIRAKEKVQYLNNIKHKFSEGQLANYDSARKKYDAALASRRESKKIQKTDYGTALAQALNSHKSVRIQYKGSWRIIDPYSLNDTYVVAYCHFARDIRTFRVDRIQGAKLSSEFNFTRSLQTTAQSKLIEAPNYGRYSGTRRHRY